MDDELNYLIGRLIARQPRESTLSDEEQVALQDEIDRLRDGEGVHYRTRWELEDEAVRRGMAGLGDAQRLDWRRNV